MLESSTSQARPLSPAITNRACAAASWGLPIISRRGKSRAASRHPARAA